MIKYRPPKCPKPRYVNFTKSLQAQGTSKEEIGVYNFIRMEFPDIPIYHGDRGVLNGRELDIYIPSKKIGIEYEGLYWHNSNKKDSNYHINKCIQCSKKGIYLISIFSDEWTQRKPQVIDLIRKALGKYILIEDYRIRELEYHEARKFFNNNSLLSYDEDSIKNIGCFHKGSIVCACSIIEKDGVLEITRYADAMNYKVRDGIVALWNYVKELYGTDNIHFILDRRLYNVEEYIDMGFKIKEATPPNYTYTQDFNTRLPSSDFEKFQEKELATNGIFRVYDCGNFILSKESNEEKEEKEEENNFT